ncbi:MAG: DNA damage-inducible protein D [Dyadobacter sp.]|uniref:DNA damage-inducible protein D n=1 Tax=Dyadobacter sp. TaxID=1914288 RepID=UPI001B11F029|nr:DNA damage-inducible protein D [Dyadobacter sp.]MBO9613447.1 DNA damage-inducible protein D [Dyadobacter sp.]
MTSQQAPSLFEQIRKSDDNGNEFWSARDLAKVLEYTEYRHFKPAIERAREACANSGQNVRDHFEDMLGMIELGKGGKRTVEDAKLSRYACYLIVQNADPAKEVVALGQTYFAVQTRLQEIRQMEEYNQLNTENEKRIFLRGELTRNNLLLADAAKAAGVIEPIDYAIFQNHGYMGLYGGLDAKAIREKKGLQKSQNLPDHMGSSELAANVFRATQTDDKLRRENIVGKEKANQTHFEVGAKVRQTIQELGGTMPENLPVAENIRKLDKSSRKRLK